MYTVQTPEPLRLESMKKETKMLRSTYKCSETRWKDKEKGYEATIGQLERKARFISPENVPLCYCMIKNDMYMHAYLQMICTCISANEYACIICTHTLHVHVTHDTHSIPSTCSTILILIPPTTFSMHAGEVT